MKRLYCPGCDNVYNEDVLVQSKFDKDIYKCPECGATDDELIEMLTCQDCGKEAIIDDLVNFEGQYFCEECLKNGLSE